MYFSCFLKIFKETDHKYVSSACGKTRPEELNNGMSHLHNTSDLATGVTCRVNNRQDKMNVCERIDRATNVC